MLEDKIYYHATCHGDCCLIGKIPLRQLVYRVLELPPSMRPLVYDFGQLNTNTESDYIEHIVYGHVSTHNNYVFILLLFASLDTWSL